MKKMFIYILLISMFFPSIIGAKETDKNPVTIYIFRGQGCPYCENALKYFNDPENQNPDVYVIKDYEVWNNKENNEFASNVTDCFGEKLNGVPYIVIGRNYHKSGFTPEIGEEIIKIATKEYNSDNYIDIVKNVEQGNTKICVNSIESYPSLDKIIDRNIDFLNDIF